MKRFNQKGFTLVEVLAVMIILGIMVTVGFGAYTRYKDKASKDALNVLLDNSASAAEEYFMEHPAAKKVTLENDGTNLGLVDLQLLENRNNPFSRGSLCTGTVTKFKPGEVSEDGKVRNNYITGDDSLGMNMLMVELDCGVGHEYCYVYPDKRVCGENIDIPTPTVIPSPSPSTSPEPEAPKVYTVTFDSKGGSSVASQTVTEGEKATAPNNPSLIGYIFQGWFSDEAATTKYDFNSPITSNKTIYAGWRRDYSIGLENHNFGKDISMVMRVKFLKAPSSAITSGNNAYLVSNIPTSENGGAALGIMKDNVSNKYHFVVRSYNSQFFTIKAGFTDNFIMSGMKTFEDQLGSDITTNKWYTIIGIVRPKESINGLVAREMVLYVNSTDEATGFEWNITFIPLGYIVLPTITPNYVNRVSTGKVGPSSEPFTVGNNGKLIEDGIVDISHVLIFDDNITPKKTVFLSSYYDKTTIKKYVDSTNSGYDSLTTYNKKAVACWPQTLCK